MGTGRGPRGDRRGSPFHGDHRCPGIATGIDFYATLAAPNGVDCIVTNPPFRECGPERFVSHGLKLCRRVIILARLAFMESRRPILESGTWVRAMPFKSRLPMMHRDSWTGRKSTNPTAFAWFVFDRNHDGSDATVHRLSLPQKEKSAANPMQLSLSANNQKRIAALI
jgi:hypothetical protein